MLKWNRADPIDKLLKFVSIVCGAQLNTTPARFPKSAEHEQHGELRYEDRGFLQSRLVWYDTPTDVHEISEDVLASSALSR